MTPKNQEDEDSFNFVSEEEIRKGILAHKYIEYCKSGQHLYGIKAEAVLEVIGTERMCVLDVHPQVRTRQDFRNFFQPQFLIVTWVKL